MFFSLTCAYPPDASILTGFNFNAMYKLQTNFHSNFLCIFSFFCNFLKLHTHGSACTIASTEAGIKKVEERGIRIVQNIARNPLPSNAYTRVLRIDRRHCATWCWDVRCPKPKLSAKIEWKESWSQNKKYKHKKSLQNILFEIYS